MKDPKQLVNAFVACRIGISNIRVDYKGILRAMFKNLLAGRMSRGEHDTQQVTKTFFSHTQRSFFENERGRLSFGLEGGAEII